MTLGLTPRLAQALAYLRRYISAHGYAPSRAEMAEALGIKSRGAVNAMIDRLEQRGFIKREARTSRSLLIVEHDHLAPELELMISGYCRTHQISRTEFNRRAALLQLRSAA